MVDATKILTELLGGGSKGGGSLNSSSGARMLEDLLGVGGSGQSGNNGGNVFGGGSQPTGGGGMRHGGDQKTGGGVSGGGSSTNRRQAPSGGAGGLGDLLGKALKELTKGAGAGGLGTGGGSGGRAASSQNPFEVPTQAPPMQQNDQAEVYLRAMIQAGLSDGRIDDREQQAILKRTGNVGQAEAEFIRAEMARGCDVNAFIQSIPRGIEEDVYAVSLMAISLDNQTEAQYLDALAMGLRITRDQSNAIHDRLGAQRLYN